MIGCGSVCQKLIRLGVLSGGRVSAIERQRLLHVSQAQQECVPFCILERIRGIGTHSRYVVAGQMEYAYVGIFSIYKTVYVIKV
jgi:hypothetical protein